MEPAHDQTDSKMAWYTALKDENCVQVRRLLRQDTELLKFGWGEDLQVSEHPRGWNKRTALHVAARRGDVELVEQIRKILYSNSPGVSDFKLLEVMDGDYDLNALAMAVVNGNQAIINLLKRTSRHCASNPYGIGPEEMEVEAPQLDTTAENNISSLTSEVFSTIDVDAQKDIHKMYDNDCDFNFLDKDVYLFLFTFSTWSMAAAGHLVDLIRRIQKGIFTQAKKRGLLTFLLSELTDGQGRTALHVAVDSKKLGEFLSVIKPDEGEEQLLHSFLNVRDSAGRTPLYRAAAKNLHREVEHLLQDPRVDVYAEIKYDAYQWGAGLDIDRLSWGNNFKSDCVYALEEKLLRKGFNNKDNSQAGPGPEIKPVEEACSTALHVSIIHRHEVVVKQLILHILRGHKRENNFPACSRRYTWPIDAAWRDDVTPYDIVRRVSTMNLAVLVGDIPTLQHLLKAEEHLPTNKPDYFSKCPPEKPMEKETPQYPQEKPEKKEIPSFLLAAAMGNPGCVKAFLDRAGFDPSITDEYKNTALHHALKGNHMHFLPHLIDFVGCQHVFISRRENDDWISSWLASPEETDQDVRAVEKSHDLPTTEDAQVQRILREIRLRDGKEDDYVETRDNYGQRQGSINLLLQSGIDLWKKNKHARTCCPEHDAPKDFATWWYEKVADESKQVQDKLSAAANAIAITASLVATASYAGPLTPPLGYFGDPASVQVGFTAVRIFVICDSLSFYFAVAALVLALLPALPLETESMFDELLRTRVVVAYAVTFLFPSIVCVLLAFAAGYAAVIPDHGLAYHGLTVSTTVVGGFCCLIVMGWLLGRLYKVYKPLYRRFRYENLPRSYKQFKKSLPPNLRDVLDSHHPKAG